MDWLERSASMALLQIYASHPNEFLRFLVGMLRNRASDFKRDDLMAVNNYLRSLGMKEKTEIEVKSLFYRLEDILLYGQKKEVD